MPRLLTLNTHSLIEENYEQKCLDFAEAVEKLCPHVIALQEVNQTQGGRAVFPHPLGYVPCVTHPPLREDNHALRVVSLLRDMGLDYFFSWLPIKNGYGKYEEGVAILSLSPITAVYTCCVSRHDNPAHWKTRKILGITNEAYPHVRFYSVHYGWWQDREAPFANQWEATMRHLAGVQDVVLMGDFNNPAELRNQGYDMVASCGFYDTYSQAARCYGSHTVPTDGGSIDGWHHLFHPKDGMRIDHIWTRRPHAVAEHRVVLDGVGGAVVSDHFGVFADVMFSHERKWFP